MGSRFVDAVVILSKAGWHPSSDWCSSGIGAPQESISKTEGCEIHLRALKRLWSKLVV